MYTLKLAIIDEEVLDFYLIIHLFQGQSGCPSPLPAPLYLFHLSYFSSAHASPKFEGRGGEELSSELSRILERACSNKSAVDLKSLSITSGKQCWVLYVDALVRGIVKDELFVVDSLSGVLTGVVAAQSSEKPFFKTLKSG